MTAIQFKHRKALPTNKNNRFYIFCAKTQSHLVLYLRLVLQDIGGVLLLCCKNCRNFFKSIAFNGSLQWSREPKELTKSEKLSESDAEARYAAVSQLLAFKGLVYLLTHLFSLSNDANGTLSANQYIPEQCGRWPNRRMRYCHKEAAWVCGHGYFHASFLGYREVTQRRDTTSNLSRTMTWGWQYRMKRLYHWVWDDHQHLHGEHKSTTYF